MAPAANGSESEAWECARDLAVLWRQSEVVEEFRSFLPRNSASRTEGLPGYLQGMQAAGAPISEFPLRLGHLVPFHEHASPVSQEPFADTNLWGRWLQLALQVERAHRRMVAWLRSRMPGFPFVHAPPQLVEGAPKTTREFTFELVWLREERQAGLQVTSAPAGVSDALAFTVPQAREFDRQVRKLSHCLSRSRAWGSLERSRRHLTVSDMKSLKAARKRLRERLSGASVDAFEPQLALRRDEYRRAVVDDEVRHLRGGAADFALAFASADRYTTLVADSVFAQLVVYGIERLPAVRDLALTTRTDAQEVSFATGGGAWPEVGALAWLPGTVVSDAVHITAISFSLDVGSEAEFRVSADRLPGTGEVWS